MHQQKSAYVFTRERFRNAVGQPAQFERDLTSERTKADLVAVKLLGRTGGKKPGLSEDAKKQARIVESLC